MISLLAKGKASLIEETVVGIVHREAGNRVCYVFRDRMAKEAVAVLSEGSLGEEFASTPSVQDVNTLNHLINGDIVGLTSNGTVSTLFRLESQHNALFITDRCNSNCLMCSQPPKNADDLDYYYRINRSIIDLLPAETEIVGITGGEPTILGDRLIELLIQLNERAPKTTVHMLSNGRAFAWKKLAQKFSCANENLIIGIPLYSDNYFEHDYIVQARDAFTQTVIGLHNLARCDQRIEIRVVLHKLSYNRLPQLARFIYKNFPFVEHIAFMGLEYVGYTPFNHSKLWIEPVEYMDQLEEATMFLDNMGMNVSIYNLQHCLLRPSLWRFSRKSISDWKREYVDECHKCSKLVECGGVFATSKKLSEQIKAFV